jgi:hypothetical protein
MLTKKQNRSTPEKCYNHPEKNAIGTCHYCCRYLCSECSLLNRKEKHICCKDEIECLNYQEGQSASTGYTIETNTSSCNKQELVAKNETITRPKIRRNILLAFVISLGLGLVGYFMEIEKGAKGGIFFAYWLWSWVWGLKLLYPSYIRRIQSHSSSLMQAYGVFYWGAFYFCWALGVGLLGGGIYKFIIDMQTLLSLKRIGVRETNGR